MYLEFSDYVAVALIWLLLFAVAIVWTVAGARRRKRDSWKRPVLGRERE